MRKTHQKYNNAYHISHKFSIIETHYSQKHFLSTINDFSRTLQERQIFHLQITFLYKFSNPRSNLNEKRIQKPSQTHTQTCRHYVVNVGRVPNCEQWTGCARLGNAAYQSALERRPQLGSLPYCTQTIDCCVVSSMSVSWFVFLLDRDDICPEKFGRNALRLRVKAEFRIWVFVWLIRQKSLSIEKRILSRSICLFLYIFDNVLCS